jgi:hypothetical protein
VLSVTRALSSRVSSTGAIPLTMMVFCVRDELVFCLILFLPGQINQVIEAGEVAVVIDNCLHLLTLQIGKRTISCQKFLCKALPFLTGRMDPTVGFSLLLRHVTPRRCDTDVRSCISVFFGHVTNRTPISS